MITPGALLYVAGGTIFCMLGALHAVYMLMDLRRPRRLVPGDPALLAGLAMLPMMASLPLMVAWCRGEAIAPQVIVLLHLAAMFGPALLLQRMLVRWSERKLSAVCALCLAAGAVLVLWAPAPWNLLGLAFAHGAAWGLAWAGQLWAPDRRSRAGASPWRAAVGYALFTLIFGVVVAQFGEQGVAATHAALGLAACAAWLFNSAAMIWTNGAATPLHTPPAGPSGSCRDGP